MTITRLDPGDTEAMGRWYHLAVAVAREDGVSPPAPSRREHMARFAYPWPGSTEEVLLAWDGPQVVGAASYRLPANLGLAYLELIVDRRLRGRGIGTALLEGVYAAARRHGRSLIEVETLRRLPGGYFRVDDGYRYLANRGHRPGVTSIRSRNRIAFRPHPDEAAIAEAWTHADGYSLVQWRDAVPDEIVDDVAGLQTRLKLDAPTGTLAVEQKVFDADRLRAQEATQLGRGYHWYSTAARHDASGRIVARTKLAFETDDGACARQRITIVVPAHRGRRLGLIVKAANLAYTRAHEPALRFIDAWNAEENTRMRAINEALGFQPLDAWSVFQLPVPAA